jgi:hypothetical protein
VYIMVGALNTCILFGSVTAAVANILRGSIGFVRRVGCISSKEACVLGSIASRSLCCRWRSGHS